eukprot:921839-Rhodomonas_salina.1
MHSSSTPSPIPTPVTTHFHVAHPPSSSSSVATGWVVAGVAAAACSEGSVTCWVVPGPGPGVAHGPQQCGP